LLPSTFDNTNYKDNVGYSTNVLQKLSKILMKYKKGTKKMGSDNQWTALGPAIIEFQTNSNSIDTGAAISGNTVGVAGSSAQGPGVVGTATNHDGVQGHSSVGGRSGVWGDNQASGVGVAGSSVNGVGVSGSSGSSTSLSETGDGVFGFGKNGVHGESRSFSDSGVWGNNTGAGAGVAGSSVGGYGGDFSVGSGGLAQVLIRPSVNTGAPGPDKKHQMGELFLDFTGVLYFCTKSTTGTTPATWKRVQLV
jgi:hypothetical protein